MPPIPITIITGFLGSGKTTLILNLIPQLPPTYRLALLKNEFGDLAIDSRLASSTSISGVHELLNGCVCCNLVGQLGDALNDLRTSLSPDRIIIETSGSAFPATLAMEVNRLGRETGHYILDGVVVVIDVENWKGYEDTSYTARLQAKYTDLVVFNKWEGVDERRYEDVEDSVGDLEVQVAKVRSKMGRVDRDVLLGLDSALVRRVGVGEDKHTFIGNGDDYREVQHSGKHSHDHDSEHSNEVDVLSVTLIPERHHEQSSIDLEALETLLLSAPKDEIYRIKAIVTASRPPTSSSGNEEVPKSAHEFGTADYILNWAFSRWTFTPVDTKSSQALDNGSTRIEHKDVLRMTIILARDEAKNWKKRIEAGGLIELEERFGKGTLQVVNVS